MMRWRRWTIYGLVATAFAAVTLGLAFPETFSRLHAYDDTGYMLALIREFNAHGALYTRVFSQYGPFYSEFYAGLNRGLGVPFTQDSIRWIAVAAWLLGSVAGGVLAFGLTGRITVAILAQLFCFLMLPALGGDAGHPVGLCILCIAVAAVCIPLPARADPSNTPAGFWWRPVWFGAALGALALVKINLGVFTVAAVGVSWAFGTPRDRGGTVLRWSASLLLCLLPLVLVGTAWPGRVRLHFIAFTLAGFLGAWAVLSADRATLTWRESARLALAMGGGWAVVWLVAISGIAAAGTHPVDLVGGMLLRPLRLALIFNVEPQAGAGKLLVAGAGLAGALAWRFLLPATSADSTPRRAQMEKGLRVFLLLFTLLFLIVGQGFSLVLPFLWIAMLPAGPSKDDAAWAFARRTLSLLALVQWLSLYPVAGIQSVVPFYLLALVTVVVGAPFGVRKPASVTIAAGTPAEGNRGPAFQGIVWAALAVILVGLFGVRTARTWHERARLMPLDLPGSRLIRGTEAQVAAYTFLAANLGDQRTFLTLPGMNSLYSWANTGYPAALNCTENFALLTSNEQRTLVEVGRHCAPVALVYDQALFDWWTQHHGPPNGPLLEFRQRECQPLCQVREYTLMAHRPSPADTPKPVSPNWTFFAVIEAAGDTDERLPTGRIFVNVPSLKPVGALLMDGYGTVLAGPMKIVDFEVAQAPFGRSNYALTVPDREVLRRHKPGELILRLLDGSGHRLTAVPFLVPTEDISL